MAGVAGTAHEKRLAILVKFDGRDGGQWSAFGHSRHDGGGACEGLTRRGGVGGGGDAWRRGRENTCAGSGHRSGILEVSGGVIDSGRGLGC